jgi:SAM-dependent methyltransferase
LAADTFLDYALARLPPAPARVLEVGCGPGGGVTPALAAAGYNVLAIDPDAPEGSLFRRTTLESFDDPGPFDAIVAGRVLHHVDPLAPAVDKLASLAPLLIVDEFAPERVDRAARDWYRERYLSLPSPSGPPDLDTWAAAHYDLHPSDVLRAQLERRFETRDLQWRPYLYRWLGDPEGRALEEEALPPIGFRYTGVARTE